MHISPPLQILLRSVVNVLLVWAMAVYLPAHITITGGLAAYVIIGCLLTLMNVIVRPLLSFATSPLRLVARMLAVVLVNGIFIWLTYRIISLMDPALVTMTIVPVIASWTVVTFAIGLANWFMKELFKPRAQE